MSDLNKSPEHDVIDSIKQRKAQPLYSSKQKYSKKIHTVKRTDEIECVCEYTGIVSTLRIPRIPAVALTYEHPLSILPNARGIAQKGFAYLRTLETQVIAGILITLADDYALFRYAPTYNGAQKNALLRTVSKDILIDAILFIEEKMHSHNARFFPALSFLFDDSIGTQNGMQARVSEWLKTCAERYYAPDTETYEQAVKVKRTIEPAYISTARKNHSALRKEFKAWAKATKPSFSVLHSSGKISLKLKTFLLALLDESNLTVADPAMVSIIIVKLRQTEVPVAVSIATALSSFHERFLETVESEEIEEPDFYSMAPGVYLKDTEDKKAIEESSVQPNVETQQPTAPAEKPMSFVEKIKAMRAAQKSIIVADAPKQENDNDAPF